MRSSFPKLSCYEKSYKSPCHSTSNSASLGSKGSVRRWKQLHRRVSKSILPQRVAMATPAALRTPRSREKGKPTEETIILSMQENGGDANDQLLMTFGYRPELRPNFSYLASFGQSFGAMGLAPAIAESIIFSLGSADVPGMVWTYLVGCILLIPVAFVFGRAWLKYANCCRTLLCVLSFKREPQANIWRLQ